jgi:hypothetical protein
VPAYDVDFHSKARAEIRALMGNGRVNELGTLIAVIDGIAANGHAYQQKADEPFAVPNGVGLFALCCSRLFAYYALIHPAHRGALPIMRVLAVDQNAAAALDAAKQRV